MLLPTKFGDTPCATFKISTLSFLVPLLCHLRSVSTLGTLTDKNFSKAVLASSSVILLILLTGIGLILYVKLLLLTILIFEACVLLTTFFFNNKLPGIISLVPSLYTTVVVPSSSTFKPSISFLIFECRA